MCRTNKKSIQTCAELTKFDWDMWKLTKINSDMCRTNKKSIRTCAELTKNQFRHVQN